MTRDHLLGWHHHAQLIADSMPAPLKPCPVRLVPVTECVGVADVDPVKAAGLKKRTKEAEQAAFEVWLARVRPSGDVESVQQQWEDSSDYDDFLEAQEKPAAAPAAALGDGWVKWSGGEPPAGHDRATVRFSDGVTHPGPFRWVEACWRHTDGVFSGGEKMFIVAYRLLPQEAA